MNYILCVLGANHLYSYLNVVCLFSYFSIDIKPISNVAYGRMPHIVNRLGIEYE